jgi:hypothetical protein
MLTNVRGPCRECTAATLYGVDNKTENMFPSTFDESPDSSSKSPKKRRRRQRSRAKPKDVCNKQLLAEPDSVGESEQRPGCSDDTVGLTLRLRGRDVAGTPARLRSCENTVGRTRLLQSQIDSDKPIQLATPVVSLHM